MNSTMHSKDPANYDTKYQLGEFNYNIILGSVLCFENISCPELFYKWLSARYPDVDQTVSEDIVLGYQLVIESLLGLFSHGLIYDDSLGFTYDQFYVNACFHGVDFNLVSATCDKIKLMHIISARMQNVRRCKSDNDLLKEIKIIQETITHPIIDHARTNASSMLPLSMDELKRRLSFWILSNYLCDCAHYSPFAYHLSPINNLGNNQYKISPYASKISYKKLNGQIQGYGYIMEYLLFSLYPESITEGLTEKIHKCVSFEELDSVLFPLISNFIKQWDVHGSWWYKTPFIISGPLDDSVREKMLSSWVKPQILKEKEQNVANIGELFLWMPLSILDASQTSHCGHRAFISLLKGEVTHLVDQGEINPMIEIRKFIHPLGNGYHRYSYAMLLDSYSFSFNTPGWIIFYNCVADNPGDTGSEVASYHLLIETLQEYAAYLHIQEMEISDLELHEILLQWDSDEHKQTLLKKEEELGIIKQRLITSQSLLLELLTYYLYSQSEDYTVTDWNVGSAQKNQIDVLCTASDHLLFIECKLRSHSLNWDNEIRNLREKMKRCCSCKKRVGQIILYYKPTERDLESISRAQKVCTSDIFSFKDVMWISGKDGLFQKKFPNKKLKSLKDAFGEELDEGMNQKIKRLVIQEEDGVSYLDIALDEDEEIGFI